MSYLTQVSGQGFQTVYAFPQKVPGIKQEKVMECGCCCVGLVLRMAKYGGADQITPEMLREESQKYEGAYRPSPGDVIPGVKPEGLGPAMELLKEGMDEARRHGLPSNGPQHLGSTFSNMKKMLRKSYGYTNAAYVQTRDIIPVLQQASFERPLIISVVWHGDLHFFVACGHREMKVPFMRPALRPALRPAGHGAGTLMTPEPVIEHEYLFSDPAHGVGWLKLTGDNTAPIYEPESGMQGRLLGQYLTL